VDLDNWSSCWYIPQAMRALSVEIVKRFLAIVTCEQIYLHLVRRDRQSFGITLRGNRFHEGEVTVSNTWH